MKLTNEATTWISHGALRPVSSGDMRYSFNGGWRRHLHAETGDGGRPAGPLPAVKTRWAAGRPRHQPAVARRHRRASCKSRREGRTKITISRDYSVSEEPAGANENRKIQIVHP